MYRPSNGLSARKYPKLSWRILITATLRCSRKANPVKCRSTSLARGLGVAIFLVQRGEEDKSDFEFCSVRLIDIPVKTELYSSPFYEPKAACGCGRRDGRGRRRDDQDSGETWVSSRETDVTRISSFCRQDIGISGPNGKGSRVNARFVEGGGHRPVQRRKQHFKG